MFEKKVKKKPCECYCMLHVCVYACNNERMCTVELFCVYMLMCVCHNFPSINPVCMRVCGGEWVGEWV